MILPNRKLNQVPLKAIFNHMWTKQAALYIVFCTQFAIYLIFTDHLEFTIYWNFRWTCIIPNKNWMRLCLRQYFHKICIERKVFWCFCCFQWEWKGNIKPQWAYVCVLLLNKMHNKTGFQLDNMFLYKT